MLLDAKGRAHEYAQCIPGRQAAKRVSDTTRQEEGGMHTNAQGRRQRLVACVTAPSTPALLQLPLWPSTYCHCHCHGASLEGAMLVKLESELVGLKTKALLFTQIVMVASLLPQRCCCREQPQSSRRAAPLLAVSRHLLCRPVGTPSEPAPTAASTSTAHSRHTTYVC